MKGKSKEFNAGRNASFHLKPWDYYASDEWKAGYNSFCNGKLLVFEDQKISEPIYAENRPKES